MSGVVLQPVLTAKGHTQIAFAQKAAFTLPAFQQARKVLLFSGKTVRQAGRNGIWVSVERVPAKVGGLGEVSKTIPWALQHYAQKDMRVIVPFLAPMQEEGFEHTGLSKQLVGFDGQVEHFDLMQKKEDDTGTIVLAIKNRHFEKYQNLYFPPGVPVDDFGHDAMFKAVMLFNRAAAAFIPELNASQSAEQESRLAKFEGDADFIIANDWHMGPLFEELPRDYSVGKLFMLHNTYDEPRKQAEVLRNRLKIPRFLTRKNHRTGKRTNSLKEPYSPLSIGIKLSDAVIANYNYVCSITLSQLEKGRQFVKYLKEKLSQNKIFDMHHGLSEAYNPYTHQALKAEGFSNLKPSATDEQARLEMKRFKRQNKRALQKMLGLQQNDQAVLMSWVARFEPYQKGFYLLMHEAEDFLLKNPQAQLAIAGISDGNPLIAEWMQRIRKNPQLKGRLFLSDQPLADSSDIVRLYAGSDFTILPSLYEPYGLTQLEAKRFGSIPITHGVDGLRSTVSDPEMNGRDRLLKKQARKEKVWAYGQTGILMEPIDVPAYRATLAKQERYRTNKQDRKILLEAQTSLRHALQRALNLAMDESEAAQVRCNGMRYVEEQHSWPLIVERYVKIIDQVVAQMQLKKAKKGA